MSTELPKGMSVTYHDDYMDISRSWFAWVRIIPLLLTAFFMGKQVYTMLINTDAAPQSFVPYVFLAFFILNIGLILLNSLNKTHITLTNDVVTIATKPMPWLGDKTIPMRDVNTFEVNTRVSVRKGSRDDEFAGKMSKDTKTTTYNVVARMHSGKGINILDLQDENAATYIVQEIENHLRVNA